MTMITPSYLGETIEYSSLHACRSTLEDPTIIIEALAEAGVKVGLPRDTATQLAAQTVYGAGKMVLETGYHPALLKDEVTTPAGCTVDGILELEEGGLRVTLIKAVMRATERAKQLAAG